MIVKMSKYTFVLYHERQKEFLESLQELGLVDVTATGWEADDRQREMLSELERYRAAEVHFKELGQEKDFRPGEPFADGREAFEHYRKATETMEELRGRMDKLRKEADELAVWGDFSPETVHRLAENGIRLRFFGAYNNEYAAIEAACAGRVPIQAISSTGGRTYFVLVQQAEGEELPFDAQEYKMPETTAAARRSELAALQEQYDACRAEVARAYASREQIAAEEGRLKERFDLSRAVSSGERAAENTLVVLEGWAKEETSAQVDALLERYPDVVYFKEKPAPEDDPPVELKNNRFANPFEIIGAFYSLPKYGTLDLTAYFGPFYMLFFGFCLGDAGYGLVLALAGLFLLRKRNMHQVAMLTLLCGGAATVFGFLTGSFFGVQLGGLKAFQGIKDVFLSTDTLFTLSLALGGIQIAFALILKVVNITMQQGFKYSLGTLGWLLILIGGAGWALLPGLGVTGIPVYVYYAILGVGVVCMLLLNNPERNVLVNFGAGLYDTYNNVTGLLGDMLSYIRLFALCLSGGTLALVFNDLAFGLTADLPIVARQLAALVILLFGHGINLFMSVLGALVHPMRLTFVEFYKNAGFESTMRAFEPLKKYDK